METALIYQILGIEEITDERALKMAYMEKLKVTNPEDDPEGFRRLREAYEAALEILRASEDEEEEEQENTAINVWLEKMDIIYQDFCTRGDRKKWKELLEDEVCSDLDTSMEARDAAIGYLMSHSYLPMEIWQYIDEKLDITEDFDELTERFPESFLKYVQHFTKNPYWIDFGRLQKRQDAENYNVDGYIRTYQEVKNLFRSREIEKARRKFEELSAYGVRYPLEELDGLFLLEAEGNLQKAGEIAEYLVAECEKEDSIYRPDRQYILPVCGNVRWDLGDKEGAFLLWKEVPEARDSRYGRMKYYLENEETVEQAREIAMDIWEMEGSGQNVSKYLTVANEKYLLKLETQWKSAESKEERDRIQLEKAWCYYQEQNMEKADEIIEGMAGENEKQYDYYNLKGRILLSQEKYADAIPVLRIWLSLILETVDDGSEEHKKRLKRKGMAYSMLGYCLMKEKKYDEALEMLYFAEEQSSNPADKIRAMYTIADILLITEEYGRAEVYCNRILQIDPNHYPVLLIRQEACLELGNASQVMADYHQAIQIYPGYYKPYLIAAKLLLGYGQYESARQVLENAKEAKVQFSDELKLVEIKIMRHMAEDKKQKEQVIKQLEQLMKEVKVQETDIKDISEFAGEMAMLYCDNDDYEQALQYLQRAIQMNPAKKYYYYLKAAMLQDIGKYKEALENYQQAGEEYEDNAEYWRYVGFCWGKMEHRPNMIQCYQKSLEINPEQKGLNKKIAEYYNDRYTDTCNKEDYDKALYYIDKEVELEEGFLQLMSRAEIYMDGFLYEKALAEYQRALELDNEKWQTYHNMGLCYQYQGDLEKAIEFFEKSIEIAEDTGEEENQPYKSLAKVYEILADNEKVSEYWLKAMEKNAEDAEVYEEMGNICFHRKEFHEAISYYKKYNQKSGRREHLFRIGDCYAIQNREKMAKTYYDLAITNLKTDGGRLYRLYTDYAQKMNSICEYKKAVKKLNEVENLPQERKWNISTWEQGRHWIQKAYAYYMQKAFEKAAECAAKAKEIILTGVKSEEAFMEYGKNFPMFRSMMGECYLYLGEVEKAFAIFEQMSRCRRCLHCRSIKCYDGFICMGIYYEVAGQYEKAIEYYEKVLEVEPDEVQVNIRMSKLQKERK